MPEKVPLGEIVEDLESLQADWRWRISIYNRENPNSPLPPSDHWVKHVRNLGVAREILAAMAEREDESRKFIAKLMKK